MKVQAKHGKVTQNMHGASRNYRYVWDVSDTTSETLNLGPSFIFIAFVVTIALFAATPLLLLCGIGDWGSLKGYTRQHTVATYILSSAF